MKVQTEKFAYGQGARAMATAIRVKDLKQQVGTEERGGKLWVVPQPFLYCGHCGNQFSANRGDYFAADPEHVFKCCRRNMLLVTKRTIFEQVAA